MIRLIHSKLVLIAFAVLVGSSACSREEEVPETPPPTEASPETAPPTVRVVGPLTPEESAALATMNDRLKAYVDFHREIEKDLPERSENATPKEIHTRQMELQRRIQQRRASARPGDIFTAEARPVIVQLLARVFDGPEGRQLKASIMDENPLDLASYKLKANAAYPDDVPVSTVPPEVLQTLPKLTEDLEYRFIGDALILFDVHAHTIADYIEHALPK